MENLMSSKKHTKHHSTTVGQHTSQTAQPPTPSILSSLPMLLAFGFMFYFLLIRPQNKNRTEKDNMVKNLKTNDEVIIGSGIVGKIEALDEQFIKLKIATDTFIRVQKNAVTKLLPPGTFTD